MKKDIKSPSIIRSIINYFKTTLGPYFSKKERTFLIGYKDVTSPYPWHGIILISMVLLTILTWGYTKLDLLTIFGNFRNLGRVLPKLFNPNWSFMPKTIPPLIETIQIAVTSTIVGSILAFPIAILASSNIVKEVYIWAPIRLIMSLIRTIPDLIWGLIFVLIFGTGAFPGFLALSLFSFTIVTKMLYEKIETISMGPVEALESSGANKFQSFMTSVLPQILPAFLSIILYMLEINVRSASILGYIGAGGIGAILRDEVELYVGNHYNNVGAIMVMFFITIFTIETISRSLRKRLD